MTYRQKLRGNRTGESASGKRATAVQRRWFRGIGVGALLALAVSVGAPVSAQSPVAVADQVHGYQAYLLGNTAFSTASHTGAAGNYCIDFTSTGNSGIIVSNASFVNTATANDIMSVSFWLYRYDINSSSAFWMDSPSSSGGGRGFQAHVPWGNDNIYFDTAGCCDGSLQRINGSITSFNGYSGDDTWWNAWHHFVFFKNGPDKQIWIDGQLFLDGASTSPLPTDFTDIWLGNGDGDTYPMDGLMDDFAVYSTALSESDITLLATGASPTSLSGETLLAYWSFDNPPAIGPLIGSPIGFTYTLYDTASRVLDPSTIALTLNGQTVTPTSVTTNNGTVLTLSYLLPNPPFAPGSTNYTTLALKDTAGNSYSSSGAFVVPQYAVIDPGWAASGVDTTKPGFRLLPWQSGTEPNAVYWVEEQLEGLHGANAADVSGATDKGFIDYTGLINFNLDPNGGQIGDFTTANGYTDSPFPGLNISNGLTDSGNESMMILAFLQFSQGGLYTMGVNSDDGFVVTAGPNPRDRLATVCGQYNGGRGSGDTTFSLFVTSPGVYPFCLRYENGNGSFSGGNAANLEWFTVLANGTRLLLNDPSATNTSGVKAFYSGPTPTAYVSQLVPYNGQTTAWPDRVLVQLTDGATQVKGTPALYLDGTVTSPVISKSGGVTTVLLTLAAPGMSAGTHTATLVWNDTGTLAASNSWSFTVGNYPSLDARMGVPASAVDTTKPGFVLKVTQLDPSTVGDSGDVTGNNVEENNAHLAGLYFPDYGSNQADTVGGGGSGIPAAFDNIWYWTNVVDFNIVTSPGDFSYDYMLPGIPGLTDATSWIAAGFQTYVVFPSAGFYRMGVNSDDGFRITAGIGITRQVLHVTGTGIDQDVLGVLNSTNTAAGWGGSLPTTPLIAPAVYLDSSAACPGFPSADLTNKIGIIEYNTCSHNAIEAAWCVQTNGGLAAIIVNQPGYGLPFTEADSGYPVTIPALVVNGRSSDGGSGALDFWRTNNLTVNLCADTRLKLDEANYGKGMSDIDSGFWVPAAGAYPLRLLYYNGNGGAGCEWSTVIPGVTVDGGTRSLLNDTTDANSLMVYRAVTVAPKLNAPTVSGGSVTVTWQGAGYLQSSPTLAPATWTDVNPQPGGNSYTTTASAPLFFRVRVPDPVTP